MMFSIGDTVVYRNEGVCTVSDISTNDFGGDGKYYILVPVFKPSATIYIPVDNEFLTSRMKPVLSPEETADVIATFDDISTVWIENPDDRKALYKQLTDESDRKAILNMIMLIRARQDNKNRAAKKPHVFDLQFMRDSEKSLYEQFAFSLGMQPLEIPDYIEKNRKGHPSESSEAHN